MSIADAAERRLALEVQRSFCVTAPAGSGKTELLIQRYLALLGRVAEPEQVLAITFTRKAAAEMRDRVLAALEAARDAAPCAGEHQQVTRELALAALARANTQGWHLTRDLARLNIKTIDSFCASLVRQMPVLSRMGGQAQALDDAGDLYREAVEQLFGMLGSGRAEAADLRALMLHFDNNWSRLSELLVAMLGRREQWHPLLGARHSPAEAEQALREAVSGVVEERLEGLSARLAPVQQELLALANYAAQYLDAPAWPVFPRIDIGDLPRWRQLAGLLQTRQGQWRKSVTVREGFPAGKGDPAQWKQRLQSVLAALVAEPGLEQELAAVKVLPEMDNHDAAWQLVVHLSHVLPLLAAHLLLVFERHGAADHTQIAISALDALGEDDQPTDLAMKLEYRIEHILVDEFQDTAINQYLLVSRLTRGWAEHNAANPEAPRTLFIVGDAMQSIYGFRNANVGLFLQAREQGFNGVVPEPVVLRSNFRSEAGIVTWVNDSFATAFPAEDDVRRGRVSFSPAEAVKPAGEGAAVSLQGFWGAGDRALEADYIVAQAQEALADPAHQSLAILGRSRAQLAPIVQRLRAAGVPFAAQDMEPLAGAPAIVDIMSLCRALANPADRVAWLALLRSPLCGVALPDLYQLLGPVPVDRSCDLQALLRTRRWPASLSPATAQRLGHFAHCLDWAEQKRDRLALRAWLEQLWQHLGGPMTLAAETELLDARRFFELLQEAEQQGIGLDIEWLQRRLDSLYASVGDAGAALQVMTLHKAKGLEFDWVCIPALDRRSGRDSRSLLLWDELSSADGRRHFLLAANDHATQGEPTLYNFLREQRREKERLENTRLLYVGATRAVRKLLLTACVKPDGEPGPDARPALKPPSDGVLLAPLWDTFCSQANLHNADGSGAPLAGLASGIQRLAVPPSPPALAPEPAEANRPDRPTNRLERYAGTVVHELLEMLAQMQPLPDTLPARLATLSEQRLADMGLAGDALASAQERVLSSLAITLDDQAGGRWVLDAGHQDAHCELPLVLVRGEATVEIVVDRSFVADGRRWVVDYKSSAPAEGVTQASFLAEEGARYRDQLASYRDALAALGPEPVRCALYFTRLGLLHPLPELDT